MPKSRRLASIYHSVILSYLPGVSCGKYQGSACAGMLQPTREPLLLRSLSLESLLLKIVLMAGSNHDRFGLKDAGLPA
jgi:hypothetical protein